MKSSFLLSLGLLAGLLSLPSSAADLSDYFGYWLTPGGRSVIEAAPCPDVIDQLCGTIVWIDRENLAADQDGTDQANLDPALRERTLEGVMILKGFKPARESWKSGEIYNPDDGKTYDSKLKLKEANLLKVSGCVLFFCQSQEWLRVTRSD